MADQNKTQDNVIQFPTRKKEAEVGSGHQPPALPKAKAMPKPEDSNKPKGSKTTLAGSVLAIALMTIAVNKYTFNSQDSASDLASLSGESTGRHIASVDRVNWARNAQWEMQLADKLASPQVRQVAATSVGRSATVEEKLRWGILEEKYTIAYSSEDHEIHSILLQDPVTRPSYILDRPKFLSEYGHLFEHSFVAAKLKSVEKSEDKTVESYTLFDKENKAKGEARFELDRHKRLISLKVEPVQI